MFYIPLSKNAFDILALQLPGLVPSAVALNVQQVLFLQAPSTRCRPNFSRILLHSLPHPWRSQGCWEPKSCLESWKSLRNIKILGNYMFFLILHMIYIYVYLIRRMWYTVWHYHIHGIFGKKYWNIHTIHFLMIFISVWWKNISGLSLLCTCYEICISSGLELLLRHLPVDFANAGVLVSCQTDFKDGATA